MATEKQRAYSRAYYLRNKERLKPIRLAYAVATRAKRRVYEKEYERLNADRISERKKLHRKLHPELHRERSKKYKSANRNRLLAWQKDYNQRNIERRRKYKQLRRSSDISFRIREVLASRICGAIKRKNAGPKSAKTTELLGCDIRFFKRYIEDRFSNGMSWSNYGEWSFDHIIPCASFDLIKPDQQRRCFHYSNLQPMWMADNRRKYDKVPEFHQSELV